MIGNAAVVGDTLFMPDGGTARARLAVSAFQALSKGSVRIASRDPAIDPQVDERMLSHDSDLLRMRDGVRRLCEIGLHEDVRAIAARVDYGMTGRSIEEPFSAQELDDWMFAECSDAQHASGTCRMGAADDPRSVVDPDCRVIGCSGLRVIDAFARLGSVTAVANELHYSQPTISHHLARLEAETGAQLLQRAGRGIRLTPAGQLLADRYKLTSRIAVGGMGEVWQASDTRLDHLKFGDLEIAPDEPALHEALADLERARRGLENLEMKAPAAGMVNVLPNPRSGGFFGGSEQEFRDLFVMMCPKLGFEYDQAAIDQAKEDLAGYGVQSGAFFDELSGGAIPATAASPLVAAAPGPPAALDRARRGRVRHLGAQDPCRLHAERLPLRARGAARAACRPRATRCSPAPARGSGR